nr:MAG TPA: hypothetical protein [Caudoviricetes sp.]
MPSDCLKMLGHEIRRERRQHTVITPANGRYRQKYRLGKC